MCVCGGGADTSRGGARLGGCDHGQGKLQRDGAARGTRPRAARSAWARDTRCPSRSLARAPACSPLPRTAQPTLAAGGGPETNHARVFLLMLTLRYSQVQDGGRSRVRRRARAGVFILRALPARLRGTVAFRVLFFGAARSTHSSCASLGAATAAVPTSRA